MSEPTDTTDDGEVDVVPAPEFGAVDVEALFERAEQVLLGGPRRYKRSQVSEASGVSTEESKRLWRALGFATVDDEDVVFTDGDVEALRQTRFLAERGIGDEQMLTAMTRMLGQTFSRLAAWQGQLLIELLASRTEMLRSAEETATFMEELLPVMQDIQAFVWRRQMAAYLSRVASHAESELSASGITTSVVGFADMSGFTTLTRKATEAELRDLLEAFESAASDVVGAHGGRIVKALGDEILFVADSPEQGAEIALELQSVAAADDRLPELRVGVAYGQVVSRLGDVYGSTVNIASRLTGLCRPGWILVDRGMHEALLEDERYYLKSRRPESVRGFHHLYQWRLRRIDETKSRESRERR